ncbi:hypothetical protein CRG98_031484 [Punica granatum]|uniref:Uncharacterized protein n=1 Tax=Punica granatum TaxID=22663 RepID=A0A2I0IVU5_PUNGR|nr:hypothetical protein CRG98_031484 [Punica granatum]
MDTKQTLRAEPLSIMTQPMMKLLHLQTMCNARECAHPSEGISSSENEMALEKIELTLSSIRSGAVSLGTCATVRTRRRASRRGFRCSSGCSGSLTLACDLRVRVHPARACHAHDTELLLKIPDTSFVSPRDLTVLVRLSSGDFYYERGGRDTKPYEPYGGFRGDILDYKWSRALLLALLLDFLP